MLMIRLQRVGRTNDPSFRVVVTEKQNATKSGKFLEVLGSYNARFGKAELDKERVTHWLNHGVQLSDTAHNLFVNHKLVKAKKKIFANKPKKETVQVVTEPAPIEAAAPKVEEALVVEETPAEAAAS